MDFLAVYRLGTHRLQDSSGQFPCRFNAKLKGGVAARAPGHSNSDYIPSECDFFWLGKKMVLFIGNFLHQKRTARRRNLNGHRIGARVWIMRLSKRPSGSGSIPFPLPIFFFIWVASPVIEVPHRHPFNRRTKVRSSYVASLLVGGRMPGQKI
jgi:hypothetical protein